MKKRLLSTSIAACVFLSLTVSPLSNLNILTNNSPTIAHAATLPTSAKDGTILQAFDWSFSTIKNELPNIAAAGFKSVQVSPVQPTKSSSIDPSQWWLLYQPIDQSCGNAQLGTYDDFKSLCTEAHKYGISIIVDVVMNHITKSISKWNNPSLFHNLGPCTDFNSRYDITQKDLGLPDLNTQNSTVQTYASIFLNQLVDAGADGFRFDAAKYIETNLGLDANQIWSGNYWTTVLGNLHNKSNLFVYGDISQDGTVDNLAAYETFMSVTATNFGNSVRSALTSNNLSLVDNNLGGVLSGSAVNFVETPDTYENNLSSALTDTQRKLGWAIAASKAGATPLFLCRPTGSIGSEGESLWKDPDVAAINQFHNAMAGQNEYIRYANNNSTMLIDRGTVGTVIVNDGSSTSVSSPTSLVSGTYINHGSSNCTLTVSNGIISGNIPAYSVIVLYNSIYAPHSGYKVDYDSSTLVRGSSFTLYYSGSLANSNSLSLHWGYSNWTNPTDVAMIKDSSTGFWKATITIPSTASTLDFAFTDGSSWDNNSSHDWHLPVWSSTPTVQVTPGPTASKTVTVNYTGTLASGATSMTLHFGYNNWAATSDVVMTLVAPGKWSATIAVPSGTYMLNLCFKNSTGIWDNNSSYNYNYSVSL